MATFTEAVGAILRERTCNLLSNPLIDDRQWGPRPPFVGDGVGTNPLTRAWYNNLIDGLRAIFCDSPVEETDNVLPPFTGGQCPIRYNVSFSTQGIPDGSEEPIDFSGTSGGSNSQKPLGPLGGPVVGPASSFSVGGTCASGSTIATGVSTAEGNWLQSCFPTVTVVSHSISGVSPARANDVDDCGDPEPEYKPINIYNFTQNIEYIDNSETTNIQLGDFNLFAPIFLPGSIQIPFSLNVGEVNFSGSLFPNGTINIQPSLTVNVGQDDDPVGVNNEEEEPEEDEEYEVEPEPEQEWDLVGCWVFVTKEASQATQVAEGGVTHYYPRTGIIKFRIAYSSRTFVYSQGIDIKTRRAFIPAPKIGRAIGVDFFSYFGSEATVIPAWKKADLVELLAGEPST